MSYVKTNWKDRIVEYPNRYKDQNGNIIELTQEPGNVVEEGMIIDAEKLNHLEDGVYQACENVLKSYTTTLTSTNWILNETTNLYEYNVTKEDITSNHIVTVDPASFEDKEKYSGDGMVNSYNGGFKIEVTESPEADINVMVSYQLATDVTPPIENSEVTE